LNYPPDGKCNDCVKGTCRYDKICFMCGLEGHGAFQSYPGGKLKGELKCTKHRNFLSQLGMIRLQHGIDEEGLKVLFKLPGYAIPEKPAAVAGKKATTAGAKPAAANAKAGTDAATGTTTAAAAGSAAATTDATAPVANGATETVGAAVSPTHAAKGSTASTAASTVAASSTVTGTENPAAALTAAISAEVSKAAHKPGKTAGNARANGGGKAGAHAATANSPPAAAAPATKVTASATVTPPPAANAVPAPVTSPSAAPAAGHAVQGGLNGNNWQLNLDGGNGAQGLGGFGTSILGGGECACYTCIIVLWEYAFLCTELTFVRFFFISIGKAGTVWSFAIVLPPLNY
jgi:hypothetical protein